MIQSQILLRILEYLKPAAQGFMAKYSWVYPKSQSALLPLRESGGAPPTPAMLPMKCGRDFS